ncbi:MAG: methyl-accepting chemotaxis protein [Thermoanaerobaculia bacterium]
MQWFMDMSVRTKLITSFLLIAAVVGYIGLQGSQTMKEISTETMSLYRDEMKPLRTLSLADTRYHHSRLSRFEMIAATGTDRYVHFSTVFDSDINELDRLLREIGNGDLAENEKGPWQQLVTNAAAVRTEVAALRKVLEDETRPVEERRAFALAAMIEVQNKDAAARNCALFDQLGEGFNGHGLEHAQTTMAVAGRATRFFIVIVAISVVFALGIGFLLAKVITTPIGAVAGAVDRLAEGHLTIPDLDVVRKDELGHLARRLIATVEAQRTLIGQLKQSSSLVATSADEISASSIQIAKGAENQSSATDQTSSTMVEMAAQIDQVARSAQSLAANVDETSSSIQEMGASVEQVAKNADSLLSSVEETSATIDQMTASIRSVASKVKVVDEASKSAARVAQEGGTELSNVINGIGTSSKDIGKIVRIIEEIADQTNLLALNAAIEAARAGDAGKGFAVVAEEVKRLAERSMSSTREISNFVQTVQRDVSQAVDLTRSVLKEIVDSVSNSSTLVAEVYGAAQEQSAGAAQILRTSNNMQNVTRQLATAAKEQANGAREIMKAVETMNRQTQQVADATSEQKKGGDMVVRAVEQIAQVGQQNLTATEQLSKATIGLAKEAERMQRLSEQFVI